MIPYNSKESVKVTDFAASSNLNASRYNLYANDLALSAMFDDILSGSSCYDKLTSLISTIGENSGKWHSINSISTETSIAVKSDFEYKPDDYILPKWSSTDSRKIVSGFLVDIGSVNMDDMWYQDHIGTSLALCGMISGAIYDLCQTGPFCKQQKDTPIENNNIPVFTSTDYEIGTNGQNLNALIWNCDYVGTPGHAPLDTTTVVSTDVGLLCYSEITPPANTMRFKSLYIDDGIGSTDWLSLETYEDRVDLIATGDTGTSNNIIFSLVPIDLNGNLTIGDYNDYVSFPDIKGYGRVMSYETNGVAPLTHSLDTTNWTLPNRVILNRDLENVDPAENVVVRIKAYMREPTKFRFKEWVVKEPTDSSGITFGSTTSDDTTVTFNRLKYRAVRIGLKPEKVPYTLTVNNGSGSGTYYFADLIAIIANSPPSGQVFDKWTGDIAYVSNINASSTQVTMPTINVSVTATYKAAP